MKRAQEEQGEAAPLVKKPKLDMAALKAKLAKTKEKLQNVKAKAAPPVPATLPPTATPAGPAAPAIHHVAQPSAPAVSKPPTLPAANVELFDPSLNTRSRRRGVINLFQDTAVPKEHADAVAQRAAPSAEELEGPSDGPPIDINLIPLLVLDPVPDMEWWDRRVLDQDSYDVPEDGTLKVKDAVGHLIEHPVPIEPPAEKAMPAPQALKLTKMEMKKIRRQRREEREKEKQLNIQTGLMEPPKPKVRLSNMARVYGADGIIDATAIEKQVREAQEEREAAHKDRNLSRKLVTAERKAKKLKKMFDDSAPDTQVEVFRINSMDDRKNQYKVEINATENRLTGVCIVAEHGHSVVIVEGDPKGIRRFNRLMLHRIDWNRMLHVEGGEDDDIYGEVNRCHLVWQGSVTSPAFDEFKKLRVTGPFDARKILADRGVAHYWDTSETYVPTAEAAIAV